MKTSRLLPLAAICAVLSIAGIALIDQPLARFIGSRDTMPAFWDQAIMLLEYPLGIEPYEWTGVWILVTGTIATLAVPRLRSYAFAFALVTLVHLASRNSINWLKLAFGRLRPAKWLATGEGDTFWHSNAWSFPSGHAILFASIVLPIVVAYPRARPLLLIVAFAMTARVMVNAHFASDVLAGLGIVALVTWVCVQVLRRALPSSIQPASLR